MFNTNTIIKSATLIPGLAILLIALSLPACRANTAPNDYPDKLEEYSAVAVSSPHFKPNSKSRFRWHQSAVLLTGELESLPADVETLIAGQIDRELVGKGYQVVSDNYFQYEMQAIVVMGNKPSSDMKDEFSLYPKLSGISMRYDKGTLVLIISEKETSEVVWRGAVKAFVDVSGSLTEKQRLGRVEKAIERLMFSIPSMSSY